MSETVERPASLFRKEVRRIVFSQITPDDLAELYNTLRQLYVDRPNCELHVCIGHLDSWFHNTDEFFKFFAGFTVPLEMLDKDFLVPFGKARPGHPKIMPDAQE